MASAMAEVVEDSEDMLARLLGGAARLGKEREGQDQIALIPCRKVRLRQLAIALNGEGAYIYRAAAAAIYGSNYMDRK
ncbi:hypothetical protein GUJ93_ZPchr0002g24855 [Zizania palustris]|uniref:Uncharacterized protein n=1 Tax=Zizania palustris TaxID=103762 RepID=A0A8J5RZ31_ZIZPA|nr:hypothetical protein GUJ93_ZPchr0002g24855 [Zizania palustris]